MGYLIEEKNRLNEIADEVIRRIGDTPDPFDAPTVVFHNMKIAQWFKAYYLKTHKDVLMNVRFTTMSVFINDLVNPGRKHTIMGRPLLRLYVIKALLGRTGDSCAKGTENEILSYIFKDDGTFNGLHLYEFADKMAGLFIDYETDDFNIPGGWQKKLYLEALALAEKDDCFTTRSLYERHEGLGEPKSKVYIINNSYMSELFSRILKECDSSRITLYNLSSKTDGIEITGPVIPAPTTLRETEAVHTKICELIRDGKIDHFGDIVVYAPDIGSYSSSIKRVFRQDNSAFADIPFRISGESRQAQDMSSVVTCLFDIANKQSFTRYDLYQLAKIPMIRYIWKIEDTDAEEWMNAIVKTNTRRNSDLGDDWDYIKKRLLTSLLVGCNSDISQKVALSDGDCLPYSSMEMTKHRINRLVDFIEAISSWCKVFTDIPVNAAFDKDGMIRVKESLDGLISKKDEDSEEINFLYVELSDIMERLIDMDISLPGDALLQIIVDVSDSYRVNPVDIFSGGVTFLSLRNDDIVTAKYAFVMGMSSDQFPRIDKKSELDMHVRPQDSRKLDNEAIDRIIENSEAAYFSFTDCNLVKDAPLYPSSALTDRITKGETDPEKIKAVLQDRIWEHKLSLDETRPYDKLFTMREFRNKAYFNHLGEESDADPEPGSKASPDDAKGAEHAAEPIKAHNADNYETAINLSDIKKFLESSFIYKYKKVLHTGEEDDSELLNEYEPIEMNGLERHNVISEMIKASCTEDEEYEKLCLEKKLPVKEMGKAYYDYYNTESVGPLKELLKNGYERLFLDPLKMTAELKPTGAKASESDAAATNIEINSSGAGTEETNASGADTAAAEKLQWELRSNIEVWKKIDSGRWMYLEPTDYYLRKLKNKNYLGMYVTALMDVAGQTDDDKVYSIVLGPDEDGKSKTFEITPKEAREILNECYLKMMDYTNIRYSDIDMVETIAAAEDEKAKNSAESMQNAAAASEAVDAQAAAREDASSMEAAPTEATAAKEAKEAAESEAQEEFPSSLVDVVAAIRKSGIWTYFSDKDMIDPYSELGYDDENYKTVVDECNGMRKLIKFMQKKTEENNEQNI